MTKQELEERVAELETSVDYWRHMALDNECEATSARQEAEAATEDASTWRWEYDDLREAITNVESEEDWEDLLERIGNS